ncbi:MAG: RNA polymerase sigma factor [Anaerolineae bacterium]
MDSRENAAIVADNPKAANVPGQTDDFAARYRTFLPKILGYIRLRVGGDEALAQDLTAQTFERAWAQRHTLRTEAAFPAWLFRIAHNEVAAHYRQQRKTLPLPGSLPAGTPSPEAGLVQLETEQRLQRLVQDLPEREQAIIGLKFVAGLTNRQIAPILGLSEGNVAVILHRTLRKLKRQLDDD